MITTEGDDGILSGRAVLSGLVGMHEADIRESIAEPWWFGINNIGCVPRIFERVILCNDV